LTLERYGAAFDPHPEAIDPILFLYNMSKPLFAETWSSGLVLLHNPRAKVPLRMDAFKGVHQMWLEGDSLQQAVPNDEILWSTTFTSFEARWPHLQPCAVQTIPILVANDLGLAAPEHWTKETSFVTIDWSAVGFLMSQGERWSYCVYDRLRDVEMGSEFGDRTNARVALQSRMLEKQRAHAIGDPQE
jgi:hypothetical protein